MPVIPKEKILLIAGIRDLFAEVEPVEELWQNWEQREGWRSPHGHLTAPGLTGRVLDWLKPRSGAGPKRNL